MNLNKYAEQFAALADKLEAMQQAKVATANLLREAGPAKYQRATVYRVRRHRVATHWREAHIRVRVK